MTGEYGELARRYHRLLALYPADYRAERGDEIVGTYLDVAGPQRRWPHPADAADLFRGGLRQRLRANHALGLLAGLPVAATLALTAATALAAIWLLWAELTAAPEWFLLHPFGPFQSLGALVWLGWLVSGIAATVLPARIARPMLLAALLVTVAVVPASALTPYARPPLLVLLPQVALGALSLAIPQGRPGSARLAPVVAPLLVAVLTTGVVEFPASVPYRSYANEVLATAALALLVAALVVASVFTLAADGRGLWALLVLLTPIGLLGVGPLATTLQNAAGPTADWPTLAGTAVASVALSVSVVPLAIALRRYARTRANPCPTCGHPRPRGDR